MRLHVAARAVPTLGHLLLAPRSRAMSGMGVCSRNEIMRSDEPPGAGNDHHAEPRLNHHARRVATLAKHRILDLLDTYGQPHDEWIVALPFPCGANVERQSLD